MVIGIIGGGASGMAAALSASKNPEVQVLLLERQARVGRKLLATGNGRCNLTNMHPRPYHGQIPSFAEYALTQFGAEQTRAWFRKMGLYTVAEPSGRVYPYSDQANSVVDILRLNLLLPNVELRTGFEVEKLRRCGDGFTLISREESLYCDRVIVACGGLAGTKLGGSMSGYQLLGKLGHKVSRLRPNLVQLKSGWKGLAGLKGVRAECAAAICRDGQKIAESRGEIQFTEYGLSGPVIFEISRDVCAAPGAWVCRLDFLPDVSQDELAEELRRKRKMPVQELLTGILHNRLGRVLTQAAGVSANTPQLTDVEIIAVCQTVKNFELTLTEPMGMDHAQVTAGGVLTEQFNEKTMESRIVPGLYACGEVLDIDGDCGGYNLQWAWSSGRLAGLSAGEGI